MANTSSAEMPSGGNINNLFELPDDRVGDDQAAISVRQNPLHRPGTPARVQFDQKNKMTIEVRFKIYTPTAVDINIPSQSTDKVCAGKKPVKTAKLNLINSRKINAKYFDFKTCLIGKSLNEFRTMVADACEEFEGGMKTMVLNRNFVPEIKWKTTVGRSKQVLESVVEWQAFVTALEKSVKKYGLVVIENENVEVQSIEENTHSAMKKLIAETNEGGKKNEDTKVTNRDAELHILANKIFGQAGIGGYAGGDGTVLSVPWNPSFHYCLTYAAAWIWAKGVMAKIATVHLPPNTREFNQEIKKSEWQHPDMGVDDRVRMRLQGHPRKLKAVKGPYNRGSTSSRKSTRVPHRHLNIEAKPDLNKIDKKRIINLTDDIDEKPDLKRLIKGPVFTQSLDAAETKPDLMKIIKVEEKPDVKYLSHIHHTGLSIDDPIKLSSDPCSAIADSDIDDSDKNELSGPEEIAFEDSDIEPANIEYSDGDSSEGDLEIPTSQHSVAMEMFLADCELPYEDLETCRILKEAGFISWTDLIPSVQLTESTLTTKGIDRQIAARLMQEAKARYELDCKYLDYNIFA
ncbi:hypothetical protein DFH28DRAFT_1182094 [Melampsora americana]|nr:hypothetical protein DFH28DRAFT_1182094 [Melampsora americana]